MSHTKCRVDHSFRKEESFHVGKSQKEDQLESTANFFWISAFGTVKACGKDKRKRLVQKISSSRGNKADLQIHKNFPYKKSHFPPATSVMSPA